MYSIGLWTCKTPPPAPVSNKISYRDAGLHSFGVPYCTVYPELVIAETVVRGCLPLRSPAWLVPLVVQSSSQKWHSVLTWDCSRLVLDRGYRRGCDLVSCSVTRGDYAGGLRGSVSRGRGIVPGQAMKWIL